MSTPKIDGLDLSVFSVLLRIALVDSILFANLEELVETEVAGSGSEFTAAGSGSEFTAAGSGSDFAGAGSGSGGEVTAGDGAGADHLARTGDLSPNPGRLEPEDETARPAAVPQR